MTTRVRQAAKVTGGVTLVALMAFGDWLIEKTQHPNTDVTEIRFIRDSVAVRSDINQILMEVRQTNVQLIETNQRLREICERLQAGCR